MRRSIETVERLEPSDTSDLDLLKRVADADQVAFGHLATRLGPTLKRVVFRLGLTESEVEDAVQEALVKIWKGSAGFKGQSSVSTWACRIAVNQAVSTLRGRTAAPSSESVQVADTESTWERQQLAALVRHSVTMLPIQLRTVIVLREFEGLRYREIAEVIGIPIGTVMSRLHKARSRLRRELSGRV